MDRTAEVFDKLMQGLGYSGGYAAQGGDWGAVTVRCLAANYPKRCKGPSPRSSSGWSGPEESQPCTSTFARPCRQV